MARIGRIGGAVLQHDLVRNGVDLAFKNTASDTSLLFLDVNNNRLGINKDVAGVTLHIDGTLHADNYFGQSFSNGDLEFSESAITKLTPGPVYFNATVTYQGLATDQLEIDTNFIRTTQSNADLELRANASGEVVFENHTDIEGDLFSLNEVAVADLSTLEVFSNSSLLGNLDINGNVITNTSNNADLYLKASGTGSIVIDAKVNAPSILVWGNATSDAIRTTSLTGHVPTTKTINASDSITTTDLNVATTFSASDVEIHQNTIKTTASDLNLNLNSAGTGSIQLLKDTNVTGNLHATGDITFDGNIILGDDSSQDNLTINADIASDIIPSQHEAFDLGETSRRWIELESILLNGEAIETQILTTGNVSLGNRIASTIFVSQSGNDTNFGDHPQAPFRTIKHALDAANSSTAPVQIIISPGVYQEETPLVIPPYCSVSGTDIRNTIIQPHSSTIEEDVFHLNGESTVENISIQNFYYDSVNNTGHAFRFAPGALITTRSPYIRNVSVITKGSAQTAADPKGFTYGDAGRGAWIDGSEVDSNSADASMLFHSCTFITPGVDAITMTNGVRVEWLNSFTYFANRGLYALDGTPGRVSNDGSTIKYGAELRSIGSACVYGNYGTVADGADTLMYLIGHNFAYVGSGRYTTNDPSQAIESQEVQELNNGNIYFHSIDHNGKFKVGESFFVDLQTGETSFDVTDVTADEFTTITIQDGLDKSILDYTNVQTGNILVSGNTIDTLSGSLEITPATEINLESTSISDNLNIAGNLNFEGTLTLFGDAATDTLKFETEISQNWNPNTDSTFNLGSLLSQWKNVWTSELSPSDITIKDNFITTTNSNSDLELRANGTGEILVPNNDVQVDNNLTVSGTTNLDETFVTGNITQTGNLNLTGNYVTDNLTIDNVNFSNKTITTTSGILTLGANDSPNANVSIRDNTTITNDKNLTVLGLTNFGSMTLTGHNATGTFTYNGPVSVTGHLSIDGDLTTSSTAQLENILIRQNIIETTESNSDLELRAAGTGSVTTVYPTVIDNNLNATTLLSTDIDVATTATGNILKAGDVKLESDEITTTVSNADLELRSSGNINFMQQVQAVEDWTVLGSSTFSGLYASTGSIDIVGNISAPNFTTSGNVTSDDIRISLNTIETTLTNSNFELRAAGTGKVIANNEISVTGDTEVLGLATLQSVDITGLLTHVGNKSQVGNMSVSNLTANLFTTDREIKFQEILVNDNFITTTTGNTDLVLRANGTGVVLIDSNFITEKNLTANRIIVGDVTFTDVEINKLKTGDILIDDNFVTTTQSNSDLELRTSGTGSIVIDDFTVNSTINSSTNGIELEAIDTVIFDTNASVKIPSGTTAEFLSSFSVRYNSEEDLYESKGLTENITFNQLFSSDRRTSVIAQDSNQVDFTVDTQLAMNVLSDRLRSDRIKTQEIDISSNIISTQNPNADIELKARGAGAVLIGDIAIIDSFIINYNAGAASFTNIGKGYVKFDNEEGLVIPSGTSQERPSNPDIGEVRFNTVTSLMEIYDGFNWVLVAGGGAGITESDMEELLLTYTIALG